MRHAHKHRELSNALSTNSTIHLSPLREIPAAVFRLRLTDRGHDLQQLGHTILDPLALFEPAREFAGADGLSFRCQHRTNGGDLFARFFGEAWFGSGCFRFHQFRFYLLGLMRLLGSVSS